MQPLYLDISGTYEPSQENNLRMLIKRTTISKWSSAVRYALQLGPKNPTDLLAPFVKTRYLRLFFGTILANNWGFEGRKIPPQNGIFATGISWSRREDLNLRPLRPERSALPDCATPRNYGIN